MATLRIWLQDKKFSSHNDVNVEEFNFSHIRGNSWECQVNEDGEIYCVTRKMLYGKMHQLKFSITEGRVKLTLKIGNDIPKIIKIYQLDKWPANGVICLPSGYIDSRRPHFRTEEFQDFLDKHGITSLRHDLPDTIYKLDKKVWDFGIIKEEEIKTDGQMEVIDLDVFPIKGGKFFVERTKVQVSNATWVMKYVYIQGVIRHKILITLSDIREIGELPKD